MFQENVSRESIRRENTRNCLRIFSACISMVLGLGMIGATFTYMLHSYETKNFVTAIVVTLSVVVIFVWFMMEIYYSRTPCEERPCMCLRLPVTSQTPIRDPLIYNAEDACGDGDAETAEM
jgi:hypothetical protein